MEIREVGIQYWKTFSKYHYLTHDIHKGARCYGAFINGQIVAFCALMHFPHPKVKNLRRVHRVVVLPDYQGIGIFRTLIRTVASLKKSEGFRVSIVSSNPMLAQSLKNDPAWALQRLGRVSGGSDKQTIPGLRKTMSNKRLTHTWEYIGQ